MPEEAKDGMVIFFQNFQLFQKFFFYDVFGKRLGGFRKSVALEKIALWGAPQMSWLEYKSSSICYREILELSKVESFSNQNKNYLYWPKNRLLMKTSP